MVGEAPSYSGKIKSLVLVLLGLLIFLGKVLLNLFFFFFLCVWVLVMTWPVMCCRWLVVFEGFPIIVEKKRGKKFLIYEFLSSFFSLFSI